MSTPSTSRVGPSCPSVSWPASRTAGPGPARPSDRPPAKLVSSLFGIASHGWGKYRFCLDHAMARIGFSTSHHLPTVRVQPRSEFLHAVGPEAAVAALHEVLAAELGHLRFWVNRVDLFADWQGWTLTLDDAHRFVCRADARRTYEVGGTLTGFEFGTRKTKTRLARLYDKTADVAAKDTGWWHEVWGVRYVHRSPVHRLEFEFGRQGLVEFDLNTPDQVLSAVGDLWAYATGEWLTYRSPTNDQTRSRWPLAPEWLQVQARHARAPGRRPRAAAPGPAVDLHREAAAGPHWLPGLAGCTHRHRWHRRHRPGRRASSAHLRDHQPHRIRRSGGPPSQRAGAAVSSAGPDYERVAAVLVRIGLRMVTRQRERRQARQGGTGGQRC